MKELPDGWSWKRLNEVATVTDRDHKTPAYCEAGIPLISPTMFTKYGVNLSNPKYVNANELAQFERKCKPEKNDIFYSRIGTIGEARLVELDCKFVALHSIAMIKPRREHIVTKYLLHLLNSNIVKRQAKAGTKSIAVPDLGLKKIEHFILPVPPLDTQHKIVAILDKAEEANRLRTQANELTQKLLQSVFLDMFGDPTVNNKGWPMKDFEYFASIDTQMTSDFARFADCPHIGIECIEKDTGALVGYKSVREQKLVSGKYIFTKDHIIYSKIRPNLNKVALPDFDGLCSADAYPLRVDKNHANRYFFAHMLRSSHFLNYVQKLSNRTNIPKVNKKQLKGFRCICPPLELQNKFGFIAQKLEKVQQAETLSSVVHSTHLHMLMNKAFSGELVA